MIPDARNESRQGRIYTKGMSFQRKQYEILGVDLGEGIDRSAFMRGSLVILAWCGLLALVRFPFAPQTIFFWLVPPVVLIAFGITEGNVSRRQRWQGWLAAVRWVRRDHRTIFTHRAPSHSELLPLAERMRHRFGGASDLFADTHRVREADKARHYVAAHGSDVQWNVKPRRMTTAQADKLVARNAPKRRGKN